VRGARELGQHQDAGIGYLAGDELLGDQVHAVSQRRDESDVGIAVDPAEALLVQRAVEVADGRPAGRRETPVDAADQLVDLPLELLVLRNLRPAGNRELQQDDLLAVLGVDLEQALEGAHALRDALGVVEAVDAQHHALGFGLVRGVEGE
jgi:hypothetical protein